MRKKACARVEADLSRLGAEAVKGFPQSCKTKHVPVNPSLRPR